MKIIFICPRHISISRKLFLFSKYLTVSCRALPGWERFLRAFWVVRSAWLYPPVLLLISFLTSFPSTETDILEGKPLFPPFNPPCLTGYNFQRKWTGYLECLFHSLFNIFFIILLSSGGFTLMKMQCLSTLAIILSVFWVKQQLWWQELDSLNTKITSNGM